MENKFIEEDVNLNLTLYRNGEEFGIYLSDNFGGSGIEVEGKTPEEAANLISSYIQDYFYENDEDEEYEDEE